MATVDSRQKVLMEGPLRHKQQPSIGLVRWKRRHVVFRVSTAGRLEFLIYKESPDPGPSTEVKSIPIEEFGGLEANVRLDGEKYTFAIITTDVTDCFATDTLEDHAAWTSILREYLGKELVLKITIPGRQHMLRSGRAQLRIRNTGFTITTCDSPPRCQGTWQIIHIKQFGGEGMFKFQTGSRCPTGKYLYKIQADEINRIKSLFNDLSQHRPIFPDDRVGRQMLECIRHVRHGSSMDAGGADPTSDSPQPHNPLYSNVATLPTVSLAREPAMQDGSVHDITFHEGSYMQEDSAGDYQNVSANTKGRRSPHVQGFISSEQGTTMNHEGRVTLSPPAALKKLRPTLAHVSTDSEDSLTSSCAPDDELDGLHNGFFHGERRQVYQNLSILSKQMLDEEELCSIQNSGESTGPVIPGGGAQTSHHPVAAERSPRNYTNVEVAKMSVRGTHNKGRKTSVEILPGSIQMWNREATSTPTSPQKHQQQPVIGEVVTEELSDSDHQHHVLALSRSTEELESEHTDGSCCSPDLVLPPTSWSHGHQKTADSPESSGSSGANSPDDQFAPAMPPKVKKLSAADVYSSADNLDRDLEMLDTEQFNSDSEVEVRKKIRPRYDCLEILSPLVRHAQADATCKVSPPHSTIYDSLAPLDNSSRRSSSPTAPGGLATPRKLNGTAEVARPQPDRLDTYHRKMLVTGRVHTYEIVSLGSDDMDSPTHLADSPDPAAQRTHRNPPQCGEVTNNSPALSKQHTPTTHPTTRQHKSSCPPIENSSGGVNHPPKRSVSDRLSANGDWPNQPRRVRETHEDVVLPKGHHTSEETEPTLPARLSEGYANVTLQTAHQGNLPDSVPPPALKPNRSDEDPYIEEEEVVMGTYIHTAPNVSPKPDFSLPLPSANIVFNKPPIPPKPKILNHQSSRDRCYAQLDLPTQKQTKASVSAAPTPMPPAIVQNHHHGVHYMEIDLASTEQLATMRKERQEEKGLAERQRTVKLKAA